jgi:uncharacterized protein (TIGR00255 family)
MILSMTGYGKVTRDFPERQIVAEIKTLNSKQADISVRLPALFRSKEIEIRRLLAERLVRGKIEVTLSITDFTGATYPDVNSAAVSHYLKQLRAIATELDIIYEEALVQSLLRWPEVLSEKSQEIDEELWQETRETLLEAAAQVEQFRRQEGQMLEEDMRSHVTVIEELLQQVSPYEAERITAVRTRLQKQLDELGTLQTADRERFEQEIAYYLEKLDINEEKVRLANHCRYFTETLAEGGATGKKLGFITQEMGREINTLGSKASHAEIQKLVVRMKDELEKIKEQTFNVL